jgi:hypothetical protein
MNDKPSDKLGGKPWVAYVLAVVAFINVTVGVYVGAIWLPKLDTGALMGAGGFITFGGAVYGYTAGKVKQTEITATRTTEVEDV